MNAALLLEHYARIADAPDAIARLRRFVLDLAVRGKLVEQDARDEPASDLLERIKKVNASDGQKRRGKARDTSAGNALEDIPFDAPKGWTFASLGELVSVLNGRAYKQQELLDKGTPVLRVGNLFTSNHWYYSDLALDDDKHCDAGDLIYAWSASFGPFIWNGPRVIYHYHIWKLPLVSEADLDKRYLYNFLLQKTREIKDAGHGISMVHMTKEKMEKLIVPLPPLAEQHRIVAKVDELMALCDQLEAARAEREAARDTFTLSTLAKLNTPDPETFGQDARFALANLAPLTTRPDQIKQLRKTILNLAVRGKLVKQDPSEEPASELLQRISTEKAGINKSALVRGRAIPNKSDGYDAQLSLPSGWVWTSLNDISLIGTGTTPPKGEERFYHGGKIPWITSSSTSQKIIDRSEYFVTPEAVQECRLKVYSTGSLVVALYGQGKTRGQVAELGIEATVNQACAVIQWLPSFNEIKRFVRLTLEQQYEAMRARAEGGAQPNLNVGKIKERAFLLPPLAEQHRIVAKVDELMALCDQLEASITTGEQTRSRLLEAVLHHALEPA